MTEDNSCNVGHDRREFIKASATIPLALVENGTVMAEESNTIPRRPFGKTAEQVSILGLGGYHIGKAASHEIAMRIIQEAIDAGVNFLENSWNYNDHRSEERMGAAIKGRRDKVFLMSMFCNHGDKKVAIQQLDESLKRLGADHLDLWQIHEVIYQSDPDRIFARGGVIEAMDEAKKSGKVRFAGFSGHKSPEIHLRMLAHNYPFDAVQLPLNCFDASYRSFEKRVLPVLNERGIAPLGMKSLTGMAAPVFHGVLRPEEALRYAMSLPVAVTIAGMDCPEVLHQNLGVARGFQALSPMEMDGLRKRCSQAAGDGHLELYKSSMKFDSDLGRSEHGFPDSEKLPL